MLTLLEANQLLLTGSLTLAEMEANGIRIDVAYLDETIQAVEKKIARLEEDLLEHSVYAKWQQVFGDRTKLGSREQLAELLFDHLGYPYEFQKTATGRYRADAEVLRSLKIPFVNRYLRLEELKKFCSTFLKGLREEVADGFVHPVFNLHTVETMRSSSDSPNFQNIPRRDEELGKLIRQCFIPRDGRVLVENDFGALEFRIAACFFRDPAMIAYAKDPSLDIHRDIAAECFLLEPSQVTKTIRQEGKNKFVFPKIYGSYYIPIAQNLWNAMTELNLRIMVDGQPLPLKKHLHKQGIAKLGDCRLGSEPKRNTFERHIRSVERNFEERFSTFTAKKEEWWEAYQETGQFSMMTGFRVSGVYSRNFLANAPIQGPGFHCLLWSLIELQKALRRSNMKALLVGQIHDCILADVPLDEVQDYLRLVKDIITVRLPKAWEWLVVPLEIEAEITPVGTTWHDKKNWVEVNGHWQEKN